MSGRTPRVSLLPRAVRRVDRASRAPSRGGHLVAVSIDVHVIAVATSLVTRMRPSLTEHLREDGAVQHLVVVVRAGEAVRSIRANLGPTTRAATWVSLSPRMPR